MPTLKPRFTRKSFNLRRPRAKESPFLKPYKMLSETQLLLLNESPGQEESEVAFLLADQLLGHNWHYKTPELGRMDPGRAAEVSSSRFWS